MISTSPPSQLLSAHLLVPPPHTHSHLPIPLLPAASYTPADLTSAMCLPWHDCQAIQCRCHRYICATTRPATAATCALANTTPLQLNPVFSTHANPPLPLQPEQLQFLQRHRHRTLASVAFAAAIDPCAIPIRSNTPQFLQQTAGAQTLAPMPGLLLTPPHFGASCQPRRCQP